MMPRKSARWTLILGLGFAGAVFTLAVLAKMMPRQSAARHDIVAALAGRRIFLSRFSGGFSWAKPVTTPPEGKGEIVRLVRRMEWEVERNPRPHRIADVAVLRLLLGQRDGVIGQLQRAVNSAPRDADIMNDLAAAYLASYEISHDPSKLMAGLETLDRVLALPDAPVEALFNRALATEELYLHEQARAAWVRYLNKDSDSQWAEEARSHLAGLALATDRELWLVAREELLQAAQEGKTERVKQLVGRFPQNARIWAEEELMPAWGRNWEKGYEKKAARLLGAARTIGIALANHHREFMLRDAVAVVDAARGRRSHLVALAHGHLAYARGLELYQAAQDSEAMEHFGTAARLLASAMSPYSAWARFRATLCAYYAGDNRGVLSALATLGREVARTSYPSLLGRIHLLEGLAHLRLAEMADSLRCYRLSLSKFLPTSEEEHIAAAHLMIAENLSYQGDGEHSWEHRMEALSLSYRVGASIYYYNTLRDGAEDLLRRGQLHVALTLQNEMVTWSHREHDPLVTVETLLARSRTRLRLGDRSKASVDLERAAESLQQVSQGERRLRLETDLRLTRAEMNLASGASERSIGTAISWAIMRHDQFRLPGLFAKRAQARLAAGNQQGAIADLDAAIIESERQRFKIEEEPLRVSYLDKSLPIYKQMIELQIERGRPDLAFEFSERVRARRLAERVPAINAVAGLPTVPSLREMAMRMAAGTTLVEFAVLGDRTVAWLIGHGRAEMVEVPIGRTSLEQEVTHLHGLIGRGNTWELVRSAASLSRVLLKPVLAHLPAGERLVIVPDEFLHLVPFALLPSPGTGRYLMEEAILSYAPSASLYLKTLALNERRSTKRFDRLLVMTNPEIDPVAFPGLPPLPGAAEEASGIAALYPKADILTGRSATKPNFLAAVLNYDVIHLATHALPNLEYPLLSALPLARSEDGGNALYAHEIEHLHLRHTRLVVLGACSTARGRLSPTEGVFSLARPFLIAGVPAVVASMWTIDDRAAQRLLIEFHRRLRRGIDAAAALRGAQLAMLGSNQPGFAEPRNWAAFQLIGGLQPAHTH